MQIYKFFISFKNYLWRVLLQQVIRILSTLKLPRHLAFIVDGNRTFAKKNGTSVRAAYMQGMHIILRQIETCEQLNISCLTFFIFSSHNWKRCNNDRKDVMAVIAIFLRRLLEKRGTRRYHIIGDVSTLPTRIRLLCEKLTNETMYNVGILIILAINYSGRKEISNAATRIVHHSEHVDVTESLISNLLYTSKIEEPELVIRSSGQRRLSDFLLWQTTSSTLHFTERCWPECTEWWLLGTLLNYQLMLNH